MSKTIICSVGTSSAKALRLSPDKLTAWVSQKLEEKRESKKSSTVEEQLDSVAEEIFLTFCEILPEGESLKKDLSAEIHSLVRIGITDKDRVILLSSGTDDGYCCAKSVEKYLQYHWNNIKVETKRVRGLQVSDAELFKKDGVVEFVKFILKEIENYGASNVILNPTGGYKALVPYTVLLGMIKCVKCDYIFEQSTTLLELPPLPVEFSKARFESYKKLFEMIERETVISRQQWEESVSCISYEERGLLEPLIESSREQVTLSAIGFLFLEETRKPSVLVPFLSRKAVDDCFNNLNQLDDCDPFRFLQKVAASKDAFKLSEHINVGNGLRWLKPGNTTDRYLVSVEDWRLLVWRAIREDQEGAKYSSKVVINPDRERRAYSPFMRMEFVE
jgi:putative CRISPR-associated protein (TIGR02619 family)